MEANDLLLKNVYRWKSFRYNGYSNPIFMDTAFVDMALVDQHSLTAPNLNYIHFHSSSDISVTLPFATRLRHISLEKCFAPWDSGRFSGLETLRLDSLGERGPSMDQFTNFLRASPGLVTLSLWGLYLQGPLSNYAEIINLESLETFEMWRTTCQTIGDYLAILRIPNCTRFLLYNNHLPDNKLFHPSTEHLFPVFRAIMASCDITNIEVDEDDATITSEEDRRIMLQIKWSTTPPPQDRTTSEGLRNLLETCLV
ncbi:hypothetical protein FRB94_012829 [Tulasnella sp. JGI-2019a]|nr:hypothetical protein FRB94_012829 [Tulasnella sp. JGI-2019a]